MRPMAIKLVHSAAITWRPSGRPTSHFLAAAVPVQNIDDRFRIAINDNQVCPQTAERL